MKNIELVKVDIIKRQYDGRLYIGRSTTMTGKQGIEYREELKNIKGLFNGYIYIEACYHYGMNKYFLKDAYLDLRGINTFVMEQKHFHKMAKVGNTQYYDTLEELIPIAKESIIYLQTYLNSNWLEQKPIIKNKVFKNNKRLKELAFTYDNNTYVYIVNTSVAKQYIENENDFIQGNEIYKIAM